MAISDPPPHLLAISGHFLLGKNAFEKQTIVFSESPEFKKSINSLFPKSLSIEEKTQKLLLAIQKADIHSMSLYFSSGILFS